MTGGGTAAPRRFSIGYGVSRSAHRACGRPRRPALGLSRGLRRGACMPPRQYPWRDAGSDPRHPARPASTSPAKRESCAPCPALLPPGRRSLQLMEESPQPDPTSVGTQLEHGPCRQVGLRARVTQVRRGGITPQKNRMSSRCLHALGLVPRVTGPIVPRAPSLVACTTSKQLAAPGELAPPLRSASRHGSR